MIAHVGFSIVDWPPAQGQHPRKAEEV